MTHSLQEAVSFPGGEGPLSGELWYPQAGAPRFAALLAGPHPYMGGTMHNTLVGALCRALADAGGLCLRFDYHGTGSSAGKPLDVAASMSAFWATGHAPEDPGRIEDAGCAFTQLCSFNVRPLVLVGYSFGAFAVWSLARRREFDVGGMVVISPTVSRHRFDWPAGCAAFPPLLVVHSHDDFSTPVDDVRAWVGELPRSARFVCREAGNHFFRGDEDIVASEAGSFVAALAAGAVPLEGARC